MRTGLTVADIDADGILDIVTGHLGDVARQLGLGNGYFAQPAVLPRLHDGPYYSYHEALAAGDLTGDGKIDIFTSQGHLFPGTGTGDFDKPLPFAGVTGNSLIVADYDRDGLLDIILSGNKVARNVRNAVNRPPTVTTSDQTWNYIDQYFGDPDDNPCLCSLTFDPDGHAVSTIWRTEAGEIISYDGWNFVRPLLAGSYRLTVTAVDWRGGEATARMTLTVISNQDEISLWYRWRPPFLSFINTVTIGSLKSIRRTTPSGRVARTATH